MNADEYHCNNYTYGESGAGGSESQDIGVHDAHTTIRLTPYDPAVRKAATVYSMDKCHGHSSVVWLEEGQTDSGNTYSNIHESLTTTPLMRFFWENPGIHSVLFPKGLGYWMKVYQHVNFKGHT